MEKKHLEEHHETRRKDNKVKKKTEKFGTRGRQRGSLKVETMKKKLMSAVKPLISLRLTDVSEDFSWGIKTDNAIIPNNDQDSSSSEQKDELLAYLSNSANFSIDLSCKASKDLSPIKYIVNHLRDRHIVLQHYYLNFQSIHLIAEALACNTVTEYLNLSNNFIDGESARLLFNIIRVNTFILSVNLSNNNLGRLGAKSCGEMLEGNSVLRSLYISRNHFSDEEIQGIMEALKTNTTLSTLDLSHNKISVLGGICISKLLAINETLSNFDLSWNSIRGKGAEAIGKTLKNNVGMEVLDLSWNGFTLEGIMALRQSLITNKVLKVLDLTNNNLKCKAAEILARTLAKNAVLQILILDRNNLEDRGVKALLTVAESHPSLKFLSLQNVPVSSFVCIEIDGMQKKTQTIILHNNLGEDLKSVLCTILLKLLCKFAKENERELKLLFHSTDINYTGILDAEDFLTCIMDAGFLLTQKHMKMIVETLGTGSKGTIHYRHHIILAWHDGNLSCKMRVIKHILHGLNWRLPQPPPNGAWCFLMWRICLIHGKNHITAGYPFPRPGKQQRPSPEQHRFKCSLKLIAVHESYNSRLLTVQFDSLADGKVQDLWAVVAQCSRRKEASLFLLPFQSLLSLLVELVRFEKSCKLTDLPMSLGTVECKVLQDQH